MAFNPRVIAKAGRRVYERVGERAAYRSRRLPNGDATRVAR